MMITFTHLFLYLARDGLLPPHPTPPPRPAPDWVGHEATLKLACVLPMQSIILIFPIIIFIGFTQYTSEDKGAQEG